MNKILKNPWRRSAWNTGSKRLKKTLLVDWVTIGIQINAAANMFDWKMNSLRKSRFLERIRLFLWAKYFSLFLSIVCTEVWTWTWMWLPHLLYALIMGKVLSDKKAWCWKAGPRLSAVRWAVFSSVKQTTKGVLSKTT